jgi:prepilin-type N-terminal cleavage/methylation domain-containing protein
MHVKRTNTEGFSLIEVIIATAILATGLMSLAGFMSHGMRYTATSSPRLIAREKAREAVESVHTARDTGLLSWAKIQNVAAGGVFLSGARPLATAGPDGLVNTSDDGSVETLRAPGPNGTIGDSDDIQTPLTTFTREIQITNLMKDGTSVVNPNLRQITVIVSYLVEGISRSYTLTSYVSSFS